MIVFVCFSFAEAPFGDASWRASHPSLPQRH